jgi:hypothetical protein
MMGITRGKLLQAALIAVWGFPIYYFSDGLQPGNPLGPRLYWSFVVGMIMMILTMQVYIGLRYGWKSARTFKTTWQE